MNNVDNNMQTPKTNHPKNRATFLSKLSFGWLLKLFFKGLKKDLQINDLYETLPHNKSHFLCDNLEKKWNEELLRSKLQLRYKPSFLKALIKTFYRSILIQFSVLVVLECCFGIISPFLLCKLIETFNKSQEFLVNDAALYSGLLVLNTALFAIGINQSLKARQLLGMRVRIACCSLIYRKILRLKLSALSQTSNGQITNLLSNDVNRFDRLFQFLYYIFISPIQLTIVSYFLWGNVQVSSLMGIIVLVLMTLPVQGYLGKINGNLRKSTAKLTDRRVLLMNEIVSGIQAIKMYAWEEAFENFVQTARINEVKKLTYSSYLKGYHLASMNFTRRIAVYATMITFALLGNLIKPETTFSMFQYFHILQSSMAYYYPQAVSMGSEAFVTTKRIQNFLILEEQFTCDSISVMKNSKNVKTGEINIQNYFASWSKNKEALMNITIRIKAGELCAIIGPVGSGKSSLLSALLSEINVDGGKINVFGTVSYSSQDPWLFGGSVRNNILFGLPYDDAKYKNIIAVCSLNEDFVQLPYGDETLVGNKGSSLSGGQKARINLARAIYREADIYLFDDPLSAVDANVSKHIFQESIVKYLSTKTRILVTHQIQHLQNVSHIVVMENGKVEAEGTYNELITKNLEITKYLGKKIETDEKSVEKTTDSDMKAKEALKVATSTGTKKYLESEQIETGALSFRQFIEYFSAAGNKFQLFFLLVLIFGNQVCNNSMDYWFAYWTNSAELCFNKGKHLFSIIPLDTNDLNSKNSTYEDQGMIDDLLPQTETIIILTTILGLVIVTSLCKGLYFYKICMKASTNLHNKMFHVVLEAPMQFFSKNPIGRILNRFAKDIGATDDLLPQSMAQGTQICTTMLGSVTLISIVNPILLIPTFLLILCFVKIQRIYLATAQDLKRLEAISRSPVFSHSSSSLDGIVTIRACKTDKALESEFDKHQDMHTSAWYLTVVCGVTLGLWIDLLCVLYFSIAMLSFIVIGNSYFTGSQVGLALSQSLTLLSMVQHGMKQFVEVVCQMTSVERIVQYTKMETERPFKTPKNVGLPESWPSSGVIEFKGVNMKYDENEPNILKNFNLEIKSGEKIGVVGRTGAGKSSLISSLFHLSIIEGDIIIDGINVKDIGLQNLRSKISIIPQQPVLFSGTMRFNLDPFNQFEDHDLWNVLEEVKLKQCVPSLDFEIQSAGNNFSIGQRQLICLARAILKKNKILVLDEATANVDSHTDSLIQQTIRDKFKHCTMITIAHRLNTIMDSDKVLVMDAGQMIEFDHPSKLLQNESGSFFKLVQETQFSLDNETGPESDINFIPTGVSPFRHNK